MYEYILRYRYAIVSPYCPRNPKREIHLLLQVTLDIKAKQRNPRVMLARVWKPNKASDR